MQLVIGTLSVWLMGAWICSQLAKVDCHMRAINFEKEGCKDEASKYSFYSSTLLV